MVVGAKAEEAEVAEVAVAEAMPEKEGLVEKEEAGAEAEEAKDPQPLTPMTRARATLSTLQRIGGP